MKNTLWIAIRFTLLTTLAFGLLYPLVVTFLSQQLFPAQANGSLIAVSGEAAAGTRGSRLIGQPFTATKYFHSRPSAAGNGYDATASGGSNLGPTNQQLVERVKQSVEKLKQENPGVAIPADLVTASGSGLDPDISPASASFQIARVAATRGATPAALQALVARHTQPRQFGLFGEPRVNVLELNLDLDAQFPSKE
jgi:potassium-transporting ATPase KdpC subunit